MNSLHETVSTTVCSTGHWSTNDPHSATSQFSTIKYVQTKQKKYY